MKKKINKNVKVERHLCQFFIVLLIALFSVCAYFDDFNSGCSNWFNDSASNSLDCSSNEFLSGAGFLNNESFNPVNISINPIWLYGDFLIDGEGAGIYLVNNLEASENMESILFSLSADTIDMYNDNGATIFSCSYDIQSAIPFNLGVIYNNTGDITLFIDNVYLCNATDDNLNVPERNYFEVVLSPSMQLDNFYVGYEDTTTTTTSAPVTTTTLPLNATYVPSHTASDIPAIVIDFGVEYGIQMILLAGVIVVIGVGIWIFKKVK